MYADYVTALAEDENLDLVKGRLIERINYWHKYSLQEIDKDYEDARRIRAGLDMPKDSMSYKISSAFIEDAKQEENKKSEKEKREERIRRAAEEKYLQAIETLRKNTEEVGARYTINE